MANVRSKRCTHHGCTKQPSFGKAGGKAEYCRDHAEEGMVDVVSKRCTHHGCTTRPSFGKAGSKAEYCRDHAEEGMVDVVSKRCTHHGCTTRANFGLANTGARRFCARHAEKGMVCLCRGSGGGSNIHGGADVTGARSSDIAMGACSGGKRGSRDPSPTPSKAPSGISRETNKRARRSAGGDDLRPVRVKREKVDNSVPANKTARACPEPDAVVKMEDMEVSCKAEPTQAAGGARKAHEKREWRGERGKPPGGKHKGKSDMEPAAPTPWGTPNRQICNIC